MIARIMVSLLQQQLLLLLMTMMMMTMMMLLSTLLSNPYIPPILTYRRSYSPICRLFSDGSFAYFSSQPETPAILVNSSGSIKDVTSQVHLSPPTCHRLSKILTVFFFRLPQITSECPGASRLLPLLLPLPPHRRRHPPPPPFPPSCHSLLPPPLHPLSCPPWQLLRLLAAAVGRRHRRT